MGRPSITTKIWLSIGIFVVGFMLSTALQQVEGLKIENGLRNSAQVLLPASRDSHEAYTAFQNAVNEYRDAVVVEDSSALERGQREGRRVIESLKALTGIEGFSGDLSNQAAVLNPTVEHFFRDARLTYGD